MGDGGVWVPVDEHIAWVIDSAKDLVIPDEIRAKHQPDPQRLSQGAQCVCSCGAHCVSYGAHLVEKAEHRAEWLAMHNDGGHG